MDAFFGNFCLFAEILIHLKIFFLLTQFNLINPTGAHAASDRLGYTIIFTYVEDQTLGRRGTSTAK